MIDRLKAEGGYSMIEMLIVIIILGVVIGAVVTLFSSGINADADSNRRFQAQQGARLALDMLRRDIHGACTVSNPTTYNAGESSITMYYPSDSCTAGSHSITWCTSGSSGRYKLLRIVATTCTGATAKYADYLTSGSLFTYLPPNSHVTTLGSGAAGIVTQDGSSSLARLHVDLTVTLNARKHDAYRLFDDIALRNGPRTCATGVASC